MAKDFKAQGVRTSRLILSGGITEQNGLTKDSNALGMMVYSASIAGNTEDGLTTDLTMMTNVGKDVMLFVSGNILGTNKVTGLGPLNTDPGAITLFSGDVFVSGSVNSRFTQDYVFETFSSITAGAFYFIGTQGNPSTTIESSYAAAGSAVHYSTQHIAHTSTSPAPYNQSIIKSVSVRTPDAGTVVDNIFVTIERNNDGATSVNAAGSTESVVTFDNQLLPVANTVYYSTSITNSGGVDPGDIFGVKVKRVGAAISVITVTVTIEFGVRSLDTP